MKDNMATKLTLTINKSVIEKAKEYAKLKGRSLSDIIENYLKLITSDDKFTSNDPTPFTDALKGSFKAPVDFNDKENIFNSLAQKYLSDDKNID